MSSAEAALAAATAAEQRDAARSRDLMLTVCPLKASGAPIARCGHSLSVVDGTRIYVYGGASDSRIFGELYRCDVTQLRWDQLEPSGFAVPGPLFAHSASLHQRKLYVFGGLAPSSTYQFESRPNTFDDQEVSKQVKQANSSTKSAVHYVRTDLNVESDPSNLTQPQMLEKRRALFASRGEESSCELFVYDIAMDQWVQPVIRGNAKPCARFLHSAVVVDNRMFVIGGCTGPNYRGALNDVWSLQLDGAMEWRCEFPKGDGPSPRFGHSCVVLGDGRIAVFGGCNEDLTSKEFVTIQRFNDFFVLDTRSSPMQWSKPETRGSPPFPRAFHSAALIGDSPRLMYVFAGETTQISTDLTVLDVDTMTWRRPLFDCTFEHEMHGAAEISSKMVVFGGLSASVGLLDDFFFLNTVSVRGRANEFTFKIVLAGDSGVGKSCLMTRFVDDDFLDSHASTIGLDFKTVNTMVEGKIVKLHIWDTAGQERFQSLTSHYYRGADGAVLVYDVTDSISFDNVLNWHNDIEEANSSGKQVLKLVVGNKNDLEDRRKVTAKQGKSLAKDVGAVFVETSARDSTNVDVAFLNLARKLVQARLQTQQQTSANDRLRLGNSNQSSSSAGVCCK